MKCKIFIFLLLIFYYACTPGVSFNAWDVFSHVPENGRNETITTDSSDGSRIVKGSLNYVAKRFEIPHIRSFNISLNYVADKNGYKANFHIILTELVESLSQVPAVPLNCATLKSCAG